VLAWTAMSSTRLLLTVVASLSLAACLPKHNRTRIPVTGPTPQTTGEFETFAANAKAMGCVSEKAPGDGGSEGDGDPSVTCPNEPSRPRFIFVTKKNKVLCGINKGQEAQCTKTWNKLNTPR
jgi:hypothetical protein